MDEPIREDEENNASQEPQEADNIEEQVEANPQEEITEQVPDENQEQPFEDEENKEEQPHEEDENKVEEPVDEENLEQQQQQQEQISEEQDLNEITTGEIGINEEDANSKENEEEGKDVESASSQQAQSPTSEKTREPTKKRPPRRQMNNNMMIAEEDTFAEDVKSPGPAVDSISHQMYDNDRMIVGHEPEFIKPTTPDRHEHHEEHFDQEDIEEEQEIRLTREEILAKYQEAIDERERNQNLNNQLHHKLADYFRKRQKEDPQNQQVLGSQDQEQRYMKYLTSIDELHKQLDKQQDEYEEQKHELKRRCEEQQEAVRHERSRYLALIRETALKSANSHTGKGITPKEIDEYLEKEKQKEQEVIQVRLENIKLKNQLKKKETQLRAKEELGEGLHLIDFEQLKIENQTYNEKIEERNEELMKLKRKINETVQILTHVKEKLKFVSAQNEREKDVLNDAERTVKEKRDHLNGIKKSRDTLRVDNNKLKENSGLLGNYSLLRDFENCVDDNEILQSKIEQLKQHHAELALNSRGIKQKILQAKSDK